MPPPGAPRRDISLSLSREYTKVKPKGKLSEIIDFHLSGRNRYMVINQPKVSTPRLPTASNTSSTRNPNRFRNPLLNKYDHDGEDDYERKHYVFEDDDDETGGDGTKGKGKGKTRKKRLTQTLKNKNGLKGDENNNNNNGTVVVNS
jgi:hypothetical protein